MLINKFDIITQFAHGPISLPRRGGEASRAQQHTLDSADVVPRLSHLIIRLILGPGCRYHTIATGRKVHLRKDHAVKVFPEMLDLGFYILKVAALGDDGVMQTR